MLLLQCHRLGFHSVIGGCLTDLWWCRVLLYLCIVLVTDCNSCWLLASGVLALTAYALGQMLAEAPVLVVCSV